MQEKPGETLTAQVTPISAAATRLSYNVLGHGLEVFHLSPGDPAACTTEPAWLSRHTKLLFLQVALRLSGSV